MILAGVWEEPILADLWKLAWQGFDKFSKILDLESAILPRDKHGKNWLSVQKRWPRALEMWQLILGKVRDCPGL